MGVQEGEGVPRGPGPLSGEQLEQFHRDGCLVVPSFLTQEEAASLRGAMARLVEQMDPKDHTPTVFSTTDHEHTRNTYFLNSGDNVSFFFEQGVLDAEGRLAVPKGRALNKVGHALHWLVPEFRRVSFSERVKGVARQLGFASPALVQSMYIFKQPGIGGEVTPHKDATFLATEPKQSCVGL